MSWIIVIIFAYFILAVVSLIDKYLISGPIPNSKIYAFYVGALGILVLFLVPFLGFSIPDSLNIFLALLSGAIYIFAILGMMEALKLFEASRVIPAIGGITPVFSLLLTYFFSGSVKILRIEEMAALLLMIAGSVLITFQKEKAATFKSLKIALISAFLFSLSFVLSKIVYLNQAFWSGFIWMRMGGVVAALLLLFSKEVREELFKKRKDFKVKTSFIFLFNQGLGAVGFLLQNWAIALVPFGFLSFINALEGTKYVFLLIITSLISFINPSFAKRTSLEEKFSKSDLFQKIMAILLIGTGLSLLALK